jgi:thiol-disulfide isomerase/thioredoxin
MNLIRFVLIIFLSTAGACLLAQETRIIPVMNFDQFEQHIRKQNDTTYVVNFWATWCVPCRKELPEFQKLYENHKGNVAVLLVSLDFPKQISNVLVPYLENNNITAPVILLNDPNSNAWIDKVDPSWTGSLPATLVYNRQSRLFFEQELNYEKLIETIQKINH